jgi:hypothetical protein
MLLIIHQFLGGNAFHNHRSTFPFPGNGRGLLICEPPGPIHRLGFGVDLTGRLPLLDLFKDPGKQRRGIESQLLNQVITINETDKWFFPLFGKKPRNQIPANIFMMALISLRGGRTPGGPLVGPGKQSDASGFFPRIPQETKN